MNCNIVQRLLLTDYSDGALPPQKNAAVDQHLKNCPRCREFAQALKKEAINPFKKVAPQEPPAHLWYRIRETIEREQQPYAPTIFDTIKDFLSGFIPLRRPAVAVVLTTVVIASIVLFRLVPFNGQKAANMYLEDQAEFLISLSEGDGLDFGTGIEEYLL